MAKFNHLITVLIGVFSASLMNAQSISPSVIGAGGRDLSTTSLSLQFTVGESVIQNIGTSSLTLNQGFQQAYPQSIVTNVIESKVSDKSVFKLYPNPAKDVLNLLFEVPLKEDLSLELYSMDGKKISSAVIRSGSSQNQINITYLSNGLYTIRCISLQEGKAVFTQLIYKSN